MKRRHIKVALMTAIAVAALVGGVAAGSPAQAQLSPDVSFGGQGRPMA